MDFAPKVFGCPERHGLRCRTPATCATPGFSIGFGTFFMLFARQLVLFSIVALALLLAVTLATAGFGLFSLVRDKFHPQSRYHATVVRVPDAKVETAETPYIPVVATLTHGDGKASSISGGWSQFRGDHYDAIYRPNEGEAVKIGRNFPATGPPALWKLSLGEGYAGPAIRNGKVYLLDYDMENLRDALRCLSLDDGKEIWRYSYPVTIKKNHGMSRTIPAVTDKFCVTLGPKCHVACVDTTTGEEKWFLDLQHDYGTTEPEWYAGQCPLIVEIDGKETVILAPAGPEVLVMAVDCETGQEVWRTPNPFDWTMTHVSLVPMELDGQRTFVYCGKGGVVGVDGETGQILWSTTDWKIEIATCPSPVILPDNRIFCCGGYKSGSVMLQISADAMAEGGYKATTLFRLADPVFGSEQQTPIFFAGHLFGVRQRDKAFVCLTLDGKIVWQSAPEGRFGGGPYLLLDVPQEQGGPMFLIVDDGGVLTACEATTAGYRQIFQFQVLEEHGSWAPMAMVSGRLLVRDQITMVCLDLRE